MFIMMDFITKAGFNSLIPYRNKGGIETVAKGLKPNHLHVEWKKTKPEFKLKNEILDLKLAVCSDFVISHWNCRLCVQKGNSLLKPESQLQLSSLTVHLHHRGLLTALKKVLGCFCKLTVGLLMLGHLRLNSWSVTLIQLLVHSFSCSVDPGPHSTRWAGFYGRLIWILYLQ